MLIKSLIVLSMFVMFGCGSSKSGIITNKKDASKLHKRPPKKSSDDKKVTSTYEQRKRERAQKRERRKAERNKTPISAPAQIIPTNLTIVDDYINKYNAIAMKNMREYGIPASIILAQGILESGAGKSKLSIASNNHFGIKCHTEWSGDSVKHDDDDLQECFRKYDKPEESFKDHALFLKNRKRYAPLFLLDKDDYKGWAKGLKKYGYATDPDYANKLITSIENNNLHIYDEQTLGKIPIATVESIEDVNSNTETKNLYIVQQGDTMYSVSKKFNITVEDLKQKNQLQGNTLSIGQKLIVQ